MAAAPARRTEGEGEKGGREGGGGGWRWRWQQSTIGSDIRLLDSGTVFWRRPTKITRLHSEVKVSFSGRVSYDIGSSDRDANSMATVPRHTTEKKKVIPGR